MSMLGDTFKLFFTAVMSDPVASDSYRTGLEKATKQFLSACENNSKGEFKKVLTILEHFPPNMVQDEAAVFDWHLLSMKTHLKIVNIKIALLSKDIAVSEKSAKNEDEKKSVEVLHAELKMVKQNLVAHETKRDVLMRQTYSVKNDVEVKLAKREVDQFSKRRDELESALLLAQSRGAEKEVMKSLYAKKVNKSLRSALHHLLEITKIENIPERLKAQRDQIVKEGRESIEAMSARIKEIAAR